MRAWMEEVREGEKVPRDGEEDGCEGDVNDGGRGGRAWESGTCEPR